MPGMDKGLILVVDDEASARRVLSAILEQEDYRVVSAGGCGGGHAGPGPP